MRRWNACALALTTLMLAGTAPVARGSVPELRRYSELPTTSASWCAYVLGAERTMELCKDEATPFDCAQSGADVCGAHASWCDRYYGPTDPKRGQCKRLYLQLVNQAVAEADATPSGGVSGGVGTVAANGSTVLLEEVDDIKKSPGLGGSEGSEDSAGADRASSGDHDAQQDPSPQGDSADGNPTEPSTESTAPKEVEPPNSFSDKRAVDRLFDPLYSLVAGGGWLSIKAAFDKTKLIQLLPQHVASAVGAADVPSEVVNTVVVKILGEYRFHAVRRALMASVADMKDWQNVKLKFNAEGSSDLLSDFDVNMKGALSGKGVEAFNEIFEETFGHRARELYERHFSDHADAIALPLTAAFLFDTNVYAEDFVLSEQFSPGLRYLWNREMFMGSHKPIRSKLEADSEVFSLVKLIRDAAVYAHSIVTEDFDSTMRRVLPGEADLSAAEVKRVLESAGQVVDYGKAELMAAQLQKMVQTRLKTAAGCLAHQERMVLKRAEEVVQGLKKDSAPDAAAASTAAESDAVVSDVLDKNGQPIPSSAALGKDGQPVVDEHDPDILRVRETLEREEMGLTEQRLAELKKIVFKGMGDMKENVLENDVKNYLRQRNSQYYSILSDAVPDAMGYTFPDSGSMMPCAPHGAEADECRQFTVLRNLLRLLVARDASEAYAAGGAVRTTVLVTQAGMLGYAGNPRKGKDRPGTPKQIAPRMMTPSGYPVMVDTNDEPVWIGASDLLSTVLENVGFFLAHIGEMAADEVRDVVANLKETGKYFGRLGESFTMVDNLNSTTLRLDDTPDDNPHRVGMGPIGYQFMEDVFTALDPMQKKLPDTAGDGLMLDKTPGSADALLVEHFVKPLMKSSELLVHAAKSKGYYVEQVQAAFKRLEEANAVKRKEAEAAATKDAAPDGAEPQSSKLAANDTRWPVTHEPATMRRHVLHRALPFLATDSDPAERMRNAAMAAVRRVSAALMIQLFHKNGCLNPAGNEPGEHCTPSVTETCELKMSGEVLSKLVNGKPTWANPSPAYIGPDMSWEDTTAVRVVQPLRKEKMRPHLEGLATLGLSVESLEIDVKDPMKAGEAAESMAKGVRAFEEEMKEQRNVEPAGNATKSSPVRVVGVLDRRMAEVYVKSGVCSEIDRSKDEPAPIETEPELVCEELKWRLSDPANWDLSGCKVGATQQTGFRIDTGIVKCEPVKMSVIGEDVDESSLEIVDTSTTSSKSYTVFEDEEKAKAEATAGDAEGPRALEAALQQAPVWSGAKVDDLLQAVGGLRLPKPKPKVEKTDEEKQQEEMQRMQKEEQMQQQQQMQQQEMQAGLRTNQGSTLLEMARRRIRKIALLTV